MVHISVFNRPLDSAPVNQLTIFYVLNACGIQILEVFQRIFIHKNKVGQETLPVVLPDLEDFRPTGDFGL